MTDPLYQVFELEFANFIANHEYPLGYRKENPLSYMDEYIIQLRKLNVKSPFSLIVLPPRNRNLPAGCYNLSDLLEMIALNLEGKQPLCRKGAING